jgi:thymidylate synthase ThyX
MKNTVELLGTYGGDLTHAMSAWTSTSRDIDEEKKNRIPKLLAALAEGSDGHPHGTPFEKSAIHFLVTTDIASHIHIIKHRIGVPVNAESARYKELKEDKYYLPEDWNGIKANTNALKINKESLDTWLELLEQ